MKTSKFEFANGSSLRVLAEIEKETAWFVAKDICDILDVKQPTQAVEILDDDEKLMCLVNTSGQEREAWCVSESGLYSLIFSSRKPEAKAFRKWVTAEVLPALRLAGKYTMEQANDREASIVSILGKKESLTAKINELKREIRKVDAQLVYILKDNVRQLNLTFED